MTAPDPFAEFKARQRETWSLGNFGEVAVFTVPVAGHLVRFAGIRAGQSVLDVACGTGPVAVTAARLGAKTSGLDLTPSLLEQARASAKLVGLEIDFREGDAEALPWADGAFDAVLSQFGHLFAPRPEVALAEMLRVLKPGGRLAFATWPPEQLVGRLFALGARYVPPPPGLPPVALWGDVGAVTQRLGNSVRDLHFERGVMGVPALSPEHLLAWQAAKVGPCIRALQHLEQDPARRAAYLREAGALVADYLTDNVVRQEYLLTRAVKV